MGLSLNEWIDFVNRHPLKMKFSGLDGFHTTVGDAACFDRKFMEDWCEKCAEGQEEELKNDIKSYQKKPKNNLMGDFLIDYIDYLVKEYGEPDIEEYSEDEEPDEDKKNLYILHEHDNYSNRSSFCYDRVEPQWEWEDLRSDDMIPYLLKEHPVEEIYSHACGQGVSIEKIIFLCPSCHREPVDERDISLSDSDWWCGMCGASSCLGSNEDMLDFFLALGVEVYPFNDKKRKELKKQLKEREDE